MTRWSLRPALLAALLAASLPVGAAAQSPSCMEEFGKYKQDVDQRFAEARAAGQRKPTQPEMCQIMRRAHESLVRFAKHVEDNQSWCQYPEQLLGQVKSGLQTVTKQRNDICAARPVAGPAPQAPSGKGIGQLGSPTGLGGNTGGGTTNPTTQGSGVYSTLGGAR